ncbi:hypothetical protein XNC3_1750003 [Xenorhabdus nematophila F1]|nr:hypothetical protein XNC3_1750003 [Xenorhabdus nematophila F1]CEK23497.1 protein of unknown function [Xenorhabdus nematophila AN6/1]
MGRIANYTLAIKLTNDTLYYFLKVFYKHPRKNKRLTKLTQLIDLIGGSWEARTPDQLIKSQLLYQLS